jgi:uncharacterized small protein (DUF1192 family)
LIEEFGTAKQKRLLFCQGVKRELAMEEEEKVARSPILTELEREDLEKLSRDELARRIERLEREIKRTQTILNAKQNLSGTAEALFRRK